MMRVKRLCVGAAMLCTLWLGGCAIQLGGGDTSTVVQKSLGEELEDLKKAHEAGAVSDAEYAELKAALLERGTR